MWPAATDVDEVINSPVPASNQHVRYQPLGHPQFIPAGAFCMSFFLARSEENWSWNWLQDSRQTAGPNGQGIAVQGAIPRSILLLVYQLHYFQGALFCPARAIQRCSGPLDAVRAKTTTDVANLTGHGGWTAENLEFFAGCRVQGYETVPESHLKARRARRRLRSALADKVGF